MNVFFVCLFLASLNAMFTKTNGRLVWLKKCNDKDDCGGLKNATCSSGYCKCSDHYVCEALSASGTKIGENCDEKRACGAANSACNSENVCVCRKGFTSSEDSKRCLKGDATNLDCDQFDHTNTNSTTTEEECQCKDEFKDDRCIENNGTSEFLTRKVLKFYLVLIVLFFYIKINM